MLCENIMRMVHVCRAKYFGWMLPGKVHILASDLIVNCSVLKMPTFYSLTELTFRI